MKHLATWLAAAFVAVAWLAAGALLDGRPDHETAQLTADAVADAARVAASPFPTTPEDQP